MEETTEVSEYKDPKDLRSLTLERLKFEGNQLAHQFTEWNNLFNIQSAIRVRSKEHNTGFAEIELWSIFSNRFLIMDREHLTDYKLFTKDEVLRMIDSAYHEGYNDCQYNEGNKSSEYIATQKTRI
jgi:hypothetical protein